MKTVDLQRLSEEDLTSYNDSNIAILKSFKEIQTINDESILVDNFVLAVVTEGNAQLLIEDKQLNLSECDIFVCKPNLILKGSMMSLNFDAIGLFVSIAYAEKIISLLNISWNFRFGNNGYKAWTCLPEEKERFIAYSEILKEKLKSPDTENKQKSLNMLFCSMIYDLLDIRSRKEESLPTQSFTSAEYILNRFANMLSDRSQTFLNVNGYAEKLHISPKYFSTICKKQTGKTASQLINEEIMHEAIILLKDSKKSIQQIADELGFANQSHFGVFFHRYAGMSPLNYRVLDA